MPTLTRNLLSPCSEGEYALRVVEGTWPDDADSYVITMVHCDGDRELHVFDASNLAAGPIARASAPGFSPPLLLHSCFTARRSGPRPSSYAVDPARDAWDALARFTENPGASLGIGRSAFAR